MAIFIDQDTRLIVQGITGRDGSFHARQMMEYGTQVVGGPFSGDFELGVTHSLHTGVQE
jgi:succinyl-CoA synthetase alpha subunit